MVLDIIGSCSIQDFVMGSYRGGGTGVLTPPGKSQVVIGFLRNFGTGHLEKQLDPLDLIAS